MKLKVSMVIMSHLSDMQEMVHINRMGDEINRGINFAKWLLLKYPHTEKEIDADEEYRIFMKEETLKFKFQRQ